MNLIEQIERYHKIKAVKEQRRKKDPVLIRCRKCYEQIYLADLSGNAPIRGEIFSRRPGCESWPLPYPGQKGMDMICPHATEGDLHPFLFVDEDGEADSVMLDDCTIFTLIKDECDCGCGDLVREGKEFAHGLECYNRKRARLAQERDNA